MDPTLKAYSWRDTSAHSSARRSHRDSLCGRYRTGSEKRRGERQTGDRARRGCCRPVRSERRWRVRATLGLTDQRQVLSESQFVRGHLEETAVITVKPKRSGGQTAKPQTHHSPARQIRPDSPSHHHTRDCIKHTRCRPRTAWSPCDTSGDSPEVPARRQSDSRPRRSRHGNESDRRRPDSWRYNLSGPCT